VGERTWRQGPPRPRRTTTTKPSANHIAFLSTFLSCWISLKAKPVGKVGQSAPCRHFGLSRRVTWRKSVTFILKSHTSSVLNATRRRWWLRGPTATRSHGVAPRLIKRGGTWDTSQIIQVHGGGVALNSLRYSFVSSVIRRFFLLQSWKMEETF
jgi:hypothetical protein